MKGSMIDRRVRQEWMKGKHDRQKGGQEWLKGGRIGLRADPGWTNKKEADYYVDLFLCSARDSNPRPTD